jgi:chromosome segregation ATPase
MQNSTCPRRGEGVDGELLLKRIESLLNEKFSLVDEKFSQMDEKYLRLEERLAASERRLGQQIADLSAKVDAIDQRMDRFKDAINGGVDEEANNQGKFASADTYLRQLRQRLDRLEVELDTLKAKRLA